MSGSNNWIFGAIFNVIATKYKLCPKHSRVLFRSNEIPVDMLAERYPFFTHHGGIVLYLYSGSMSLPISYRKTGKNVSALKNFRLLSVCSRNVVQISAMGVYETCFQRPIFPGLRQRESFAHQIIVEYHNAALFYYLCACGQCNFYGVF